MIRRSTLVLLTCMATCCASAGAAMGETQNAANKSDIAKTAADRNLSGTASIQDALLIATASADILAQVPDSDTNLSAVSGGLDVNSRGEAVKVLQRRLEAGGYYNGPLDGIYGLDTERAVRAFQSDADVPETGSLNDETWQRLQAATGDLTGESATEMATTGAGSVAQADIQPNSTETAPTASELPAESDADAIAVEASEGGLGRVFGLSLGLVAVLASFGIGFFLANKDKSADEDGEWGELSSDSNASSPNVSSPNAHNPSAFSANSAQRAFTQTEVALPSESSAAMDVARSTSQSVGMSGIAPLAAPASGQMTGQMGGTSPLTQGDIIDGLIGDLRNPDPARRRKAIWELGQRGNSVAMKPLVDAMVDADSKEKSLVLAALSEIGIRSLKPMSKALAIALQDDNPEVRKNAIRDLTRVYDLVVQISQMLGHATEDEDPEVRQTATWALEQLSRIRRTQDIDANVRSFSGASNPTAPIDLLSSEASLRRSSQ